MGGSQQRWRGAPGLEAVERSGGPGLLVVLRVERQDEGHPVRGGRAENLCDSVLLYLPKNVADEF